MGNLFDRVFPSYNAVPRQPGTSMELATHVEPEGLPVRVANPPTTLPTSPLNSNQPITVVQLARETYAGTGIVSRKQFLSIPAAHGVYKLLTNVAGSLPYHAINGKGERIDHPLLEQPERAYPRIVTIGRTAGDILLDGCALWVVTERVGKWPSFIRRIPKSDWTQNQSTGEVRISGQSKPVPPENVIMFPSIEEGGILSICSQPVRMYYALQRARASYLDNPQAREFFQGGENSPTNDEVMSFLGEWRQARLDGITGYVPFGVTLEQIDMMTPEQLAMQAAEESIVAEFARMLNVDPGWLALSMNNRTYSNIIDERRNFLDFNLMPAVVQPIEQRLSMGDVTPLGTKVKANVDSFLRQDAKSRYEAHEIGLTNKFITLEEVRGLEDRPPLPEQPAIEAPAPEATQ